MASSTQSAVNYVKQARIHLVKELTNFSVIVENLYQQEVFGDEEVSKIKAETDDYDRVRTILDKVIKKGEAACYKLLRIIDVTRKRTLGRPSLLPGKMRVASTEAEKFDLHHWISCFSFQEETQTDSNYLQGPRPCHRYQTQLKSKVRKKSNDFWKTNRNLFNQNIKPDLSYTPLVLDTEGNVSPYKIKKLKSKKSKMSRPKKMRTYIPKDRPEISPHDLLKTDKNIVLVGKPGIGKTALIHEMMRLWAERESEELDYMFYFDMRETSHFTKDMNLEHLLFSVFSEPDEDKDEVFNDMKKNSDNVTVIFDGITDQPPSIVQKLVEKELLCHAKIIITCRPDDEEEDFLSGDFLRVEVKGFSEQSIKTYLSATLRENQKKVVSNLELFTLCYVPVYALMVAACFSSDESPQPCTTTEIYIEIVRFWLQMKSNTKKKGLNPFIKNQKEEILALADKAFRAAERKTVNLPDRPCEEGCVLSFLNPLVINVGRTETKTSYAFLHYTMQEFFAALWLLKNPEKVKDVFQQSLTTEKKHMKHLIPFMCGLLNEKSPSLMKCLIPAEELKKTSDCFFKEMIDTYFDCLHERDEADTEDSGTDVDILFLCQCLYESQCPEACSYLLNKLDYCLDLREQSLDPYSCCAVAFVVAESKERKIRLNLEDVTVSEQGVRRLFGCLQNVQWCDPLPQQLWQIFLLSEEQMDYNSLLDLDGNQLHLPVEGRRRLFERAVEVLQKIHMKVNVCLHWDRPTPVCPSLCKSLLEALPQINSLSFSSRFKVSDGTKLFVKLFSAAAEREQQTGEKILELLSSVCGYETFPLCDIDDDDEDDDDCRKYQCDFLLDLFSHVKDSETKTGLSLLPTLQSVFQSTPSVWVINLSETKTSVLLEVLKLQSEKKHVKLTSCSHEESEVMSFLQCLPHISQLSFSSRFEVSDGTKLFVKLFSAAAEREQQTGEKILELLSSVCSYKKLPLEKNWYHFLPDLFSHVKDSETKTGLSLLPTLQSVFQSTPSVWVINLSETKTSVLLEVLKLQSEKKHVKLTSCSHEESEVRSFLQCLPHISQLSFSSRFKVSDGTKLFVNLFSAAAEREQQTGEKILELLSSVCGYETFPLCDIDDDDCREYQCDFLLDLFSHVKDSETKTGLSLLPTLQSVFQSTPSVWFIDLSETKTSVLLEVLKLQSEKKHVKLTSCSHEESEVRSFLQCLPHISQLSFFFWFEVSDGTELFVNLFSAAAEREQQTGEKILELLSSVCGYETFPFGDIYGDEDRQHQCDFLLDLFLHVKFSEIKTGLSLLPTLQSVFQSTPSVWFIDLSETKTSVLLEVLKLQSEKKHVKLTSCSHDKSDMRSFLQCLPHISQLSFSSRFKVSDGTKLFVNLFSAAAEREQQTGEKILELLSSVCGYEKFPLGDIYRDKDRQYQCDFLLDLFSHVKDSETKTGLSLLPTLQSVFQSTPSVWVINLSETKTSVLLEVLKLQSEKKHVELTSCSHEESEVRSFLQCLPHISQLSFSSRFEVSDGTKLFVNLFSAAAEREQQTGEKILELLSSVCGYETFPLEKNWNHFLPDLFSHVKDSETKTGLSLLPTLQSVFQSTPSVWVINLSETKTSVLLEVLKLQSEKKHVKLTSCSHEESDVRSFLQCLPHISQLSFSSRFKVSDGTKLFVKLFSAAAEREQQTGEKILELLSSVCGYEKFPLGDIDDDDEDEDDCRKYQCDFLLDLFSHVKDSETKTGLSLLPTLQSVFQSTPSVWFINLSETKTSVLLEVLKLQSEKKHVELTSCSHEESEVRSFLQCLPHISQLSFFFWFEVSDGTELFVNLFSAAAEREQQTGEKILELLSSVCGYETFPFGDIYGDEDRQHQCDFLLDLFLHVKFSEIKTGLSLLPTLQSVFQSTPSVWFIDLSETLMFVLLEVLKLQSEKKHVKLTSCSHDKSDMRSFLQCLPHISQLSFSSRFKVSDGTKLFVNLFSAAAEREQQTGEKILELLSSVCGYEKFPLGDIYRDKDRQYQCDFLLDLFSHVKDSETKTGLSLLPTLQSVFQSTPSVWVINLSETKTSVLLEVLKLQSEKKHVELTSCSHEESEVRSFLQCLPHISQLSFLSRFKVSDGTKLFVKLFSAAAEREQQTGEKIPELLSSVCGYETFPLGDIDDDDEDEDDCRKYQCDFLLDLFSHVKDSETKTGLSLLPTLQSVFQSTPSVWFIDLSETKTSVLLEVLKLQSEKKHVELTSCSHEESEVRSFLQCLPHISQLSFLSRFKVSDGTKLFVKLFSAAAEREQQTGEKILELLSSVCGYETFPLGDIDDDDEDEDDCRKYQCDFLLDLFSHVKDSETKTGLSLLPTLQSVFQSTPSVWFIDLSETKTSVLLEVLKLQSEKKHVELTSCSHEESEVRSFLQCLPHISQLSFFFWFEVSDGTELFVNLLSAAAEREQQTGEKILELLSSVCGYETFPFGDIYGDEDRQYQCDFLLDLFLHVKFSEIKTGLSLLPTLQSVFQSTPSVWFIDLSETLMFVLLEVLKLQSEKKHVKLTSCSHDKSDMRSFLQCLPHISQLSFSSRFKVSDGTKLFVNLFSAAAEREQQTGEKILELLSSVCGYEKFPLGDIYRDKDRQYQCDFLLDLFSHVKDSETKTGLSLLPTLQSVFQSTPSVWVINLSETKTSVLLEVLKLQSEKKHVELTSCSHEESEVRSFLQCLPHISQLSFSSRFKVSDGTKLFVNLFSAAAEREQQTGEKILELLSSVCGYEKFPLGDIYRDKDRQYQCDFLLDLFSHVKDSETKTGLSLLPTLQSVFQSTPSVWVINLSETKTSVLLEVLKLQSEKKHVELTSCSHEESEVRSFLQCLPHISQLSFLSRFKVSDGTKLFVKLFSAAAEREQQTGEKIPELLSSVCGYETFPLGDIDDDDEDEDDCRKYQCDFLLDLFSHVKDSETKTGLSLLPTLQSVFQSTPSVWFIDLSETKTSVLLEVLKLQSEKKHVELTSCSHEESEVRSFLQCLPHISQLSFSSWFEVSDGTKLFVNLFSAAAEREQQTGEKILELLSSVCGYETFPFGDIYGDEDRQYQCDFLLDLFSHVKDSETKTGLSLLPTLQSVFQSTPSVWFIDLSETKTSVLLEVLKLQSEKKHVKLTSCSHDKNDMRSFLQCLPHISQLSCPPDFFQSVCTSICVKSREKAQQLSSLLQLLGFTVSLTGELHMKTCRSLRRVLTLCVSNVNLILTPRKLSVRGVSLLFTPITQLHSLRLSYHMVLLLFGLVRRGRLAGRLTIKELSLSPSSERPPPSDRVMLRVVSCLSSLLRHWTVRHLDLTELCVPAHCLITPLLHDGPLTIKLSKDTFQQLLDLFYEIQDQDLMLSLLTKVGGDLTSCSLNWELLHYLLQLPSAQTITVNLRENYHFLQENVTRLLPFLDRVLFKRTSPSFVLTAIREIYKARSSQTVACLLRSCGHVINLTCRELDLVDCAAVLFILQHSDGVELNLLWTSIPTGAVKSILLTLGRVSQLSVDRNLLLRFIHCCAASDDQQGAATGLFRTLRHKLDLSCSSCVQLSEKDKTETLRLTGGDCRAVATILRHSSQDTQLDLRDCQVDDSGLDLLFPVLDRVRLRASKDVLLQLLFHLYMNGDAARAMSLCRALGEELDLSHTKLDQTACEALAQMLEFCEGLTELDLSHCQLTDQLLFTLIQHLHKVQDLDLSHNEITDASSDMLLRLFSINPSINSVKLFRNNIKDREPFKKHKVEIW